jgi:hypothetical protein
MPDTYGTNGFHLPFSDNSTAAALGTDTSSNGNDWTVNNISVGSTVSYITGSTLDTPINAFDGSLSTSATIDATTRTLTNQSITVGSQFEVYTNTGGLAFTSSFKVAAYDQTGGTITFNWSGGSYAWSLPTENTENFTELAPNLVSPITSITWYTPDTQGPYIRAIDVDNVRLVDNQYTNTDSLVDSPTNYGTDTGAGGAGEGELLRR